MNAPKYTLWIVGESMDENDTIEDGVTIHRLDENEVARLEDGTLIRLDENGIAWEMAPGNTAWEPASFEWAD